MAYCALLHCNAVVYCALLHCNAVTYCALVAIGVFVLFSLSGNKRRSGREEDSREERSYHGRQPRLELLTTVTITGGSVRPSSYALTIQQIIAS